MVSLRVREFLKEVTENPHFSIFDDESRTSRLNIVYTHHTLAFFNINDRTPWVYTI